MSLKRGSHGGAPRRKLLTKDQPLWLRPECRSSLWLIQSSLMSSAAGESSAFNGVARLFLFLPQQSKTTYN